MVPYVLEGDPTVKEREGIAVHFGSLCDKMVIKSFHLSGVVACTLPSSSTREAGVWGVGRGDEISSSREP